MIIFLTAMGHSVGLGNASRVRSVALALALRNYHNGSVVVADPDGLADSLDWVGLQVAVFPSLPEALNTVVSLGHENPNSMVVTDLPGLTNQHALTFRAAGLASLVHLCIPGSDSYACDLLVTGFPGALPLQPAAKMMSSGAEYLVVRPEVLKRRPAAIRPGSGISSILIAMGGSDPHGNSKRMLAWFEPVDVELSVLLGPGVMDAKADLTRLGGVTILRPQTPDEVVVALMGHDLVVTQGGLISAEAMCLGTAVACIRSPGMEAFTSALAEAGLVSLVDLNLQVGERLRWLAEEPWMAHRSQAFAVIDGRGADRIASRIMSVHAGG